MRLVRSIRVFVGLCVLLAGSAQAANFPALTGRVVDGAQILSPTTKQNLEGQLANFEAQTSDQLVVVTVPSLGGQTIDDYGYQLGRYWGIGQKGKNNGVLLIVAPNDRKVRIEVGYGLEGTLTDAVTSQILHTIVLPAFKAGNMQGGIVQATQTIISVVNGGTLVAPQQQSMSSTNAHGGDSTKGYLVLGFVALVLFSQLVLFVLYLVLSILAFIFSLFGLNGLRTYLQQKRARIVPDDRLFLLWLLMPSHRITGSGGGSFGGFSGGGGSFGGGGSSGSW